MSRPCMIGGEHCEEEAMPDSPFCNACDKGLSSSFTFCEEHEVVYLNHFRCPTCVLAELGFRMDVLHDDYPYGENGKYIKGKDIR